MQTTSWLPQCEAATFTPMETITEHLDAPALITEAPILTAQVGATQYGPQIGRDDDLFIFVTNFQENHSELYDKLLANRIPPPEAEDWSELEEEDVKALLKFIIAAYEAPNMLIQPSDKYAYKRIESVILQDPRYY